MELDNNAPKYSDSARWYNPEQKIVTNIISIKQTKEAMDAAENILKRFLAHVREEEPDVQLFLLNRDDERFQFVTYEVYKNEHAVKLHLGSKHMKELIKAEKDADVKRADNDVHHERLVSQIGPRNMEGHGTPEEL